MARIVACTRATMAGNERRPNTRRARRARCAASSSRSATRGPRRPTPAAAPSPICSTAAGHAVVGRTIVKDDADAGARHASSASSPTPTCRRSSRPAAPASRRATAPTRRSAALLQKRLDGFGELFRMLSYEQIGPAAMMSRACAGLVAGRIVVSLPGSEAAVRLAMERLLDPGARASRAASETIGSRGSGSWSSRDHDSRVQNVAPVDASFDHDLARRSAAPARGGGPADRAHRARAARGRGRTGRGGRRHVADRRAAVRAIGDGRLRRRRRRHRAARRDRRRRGCGCSIASTPASCRRSTVDARHLRRNRDRRAAARPAPTRW